MIVVGVLDGYSASTRKTKTSDIVRNCMYDSKCTYEMTHMKSGLILSRYRPMTRYLLAKSGKDRTLLLVGKSLGATHVAKYVLPRVLKADWKGVFVLTLDPNWPTWRDWSPNLNDQILYLPSGTRCKIDRAVNIYVESEDRRQQCGSRVKCNDLYVINKKLLALHGYNHYNFVEGTTVRSELNSLIKQAEECDD